MGPTNTGPDDERNTLDTQEYLRLVAEGKALKGQEEGVQWRWGDLLTNLAPVASDRPLVMNELAKFAKDVWPEFAEDPDTINGKATTLGNYRETAIAFPEGKRQKNVSYTIHRELRDLERSPAGETRYELLDRIAADPKRWSVSKARQEAGKKAFANITPQTATEKARRASQYLADEEAADQFISNPDNHQAVLRALGRMATKVETQANQVIDKVAPDARAASKTTRLLGRLASLRLQMNDTLRDLQEHRSDLSDAEWKLVRNATDELGNSFEWLESFVSGGNVEDVEEFLREQQA